MLHNMQQNTIQQKSNIYAKMDIFISCWEYDYAFSIC